MTTPTFTPTDIVNFAAAKDGVNLATAFDQLVGQRVVDAIQAKKQEFAQSMFNEPEESEEEQTEVAADEEQEEQGEQEAGEATEQPEQTETEESDEDTQSTD